MNIPKELFYTKSHEWVRMLSDTTAEIGITDFAQHALGDLVFINLPAVGDAVSKGETFADVESVKAVSDVFCPVSGVVEAVNEELLDAPQKINEDPYGAWFIRVKDLTDHEEYLNAEQYEKACAEEE